MLDKDCFGTKFYLQMFNHFLGEKKFFFGSFIIVIFVVFALLSLIDEP